MNNKISVVMPTYNGEKYIEEQLMSILNQTVKPDEIIVSDDGSKDNTLAIAKQFKKTAEKSGIDVRILTDNPEHGWIKNYEWASIHATGDFIFNCDQDDIWMENKIEEVIKVFREHPEALYVAHGLSITNADGNVISEVSMFQHIGWDEPASTADVINLNSEEFLQVCVSRDLIHCLATCVSKKLLNLSVPFPKGCAADKWEPFCAILCGGGILHKQITGKAQIA